MDLNTILQSVLNGLMLGLVYVLISLGLTLVLGIMHIVNFAHGQIYMLGAFALYSLCVSLGLNYGLAIVLSIILLFIFGLLVEKLLFGLFPGPAGFLPTMIVCLGLMVILPNLMAVVFGPNSKTVPSVVGGTFRFGGMFLNGDRLMVIGACIVLVAGLFFFITRSKAGRAMMATEQDSDAAAMMGISMSQVRLMCMGIGCALAGAAAGLVAPVSSTTPWIGSTAQIKSFIVVIIGGMGSVPGAILGGLFLGFFESFSIIVMSSPISSMVLFGLLIFLLVIRPRGLMGHA